MVEIMGFGVRPWFCIQALPCTRCVTLGRLLNLSEPQFPCLSNRNSDAFPSGCLQALHEVIHKGVIPRTWHTAGN